jgi:transposase
MHAAHMTIPEELRRLREEARTLRQQNARLNKSWNTQKQRSTRLEEELRKHKHEIIHLEEAQEKLKKEIDKLTKQRDRYKNIIFKAKTERDKNKDKDTNHKTSNTEGSSKKKQKRGGQVGHKGNSRKKPEHIDQHKRIYFHHCPDCGNPVKRGTSWWKHIVEDIPEIVQSIVTCYERERQWCSHCKKELCALPDRVIPGSRLGLNLIVWILIERYICRQPFEIIVQKLSIYYGLTISTGGVVQIVKRAKEWFGSSYDDILTQIRQSHVKYADETSWRIRGQPSWCWLFSSKESAYYTIEDTRGKGVAEEAIGNEECENTDVLVRDNYAAYWGLDMQHQACWFHLLKVCKEEAEASRSSEEVKSIYQNLKDQFKRLQNITSQSFNQKGRKATYADELQELQTIISKKYQEEDARSIQTRIANQNKGKWYITALLHEDVPLTNNHGERLIKPMVVTRKISGGSQSNEGAKTHAVNMSIIQTMRLRKQQLVPTLHKTLLNGYSSTVKN